MTPSLPSRAATRLGLRTLVLVGMILLALLVLATTLPDQTAKQFASKHPTWAFEWVGRGGGEGFIVSKRGISGARPLIILNHQAGVTERVFLTAPEHLSVLTALVEAGYVVAASRQWDDAVGENSWGNPAALQANVDLYKLAIARYEIDTDKVVMVGMSMGGFPTMTAFGDGRIPLKGAACFDCMLNLRHTYSIQDTPAIARAYRITDDAGYRVATEGNDPRLLGTAPFAGKSFIFFTNTKDSIASPAENTLAFAAQIAGVAREARVVTYSGGHLENVGASVPALVDFLDRCFSAK